MAPYLPSLGSVHVDSQVQAQGLGEGQAQAVPGAGRQPQVPADRHEFQQIRHHQAHLILQTTKASQSALRNTLH